MCQRFEIQKGLYAFPDCNQDGNIDKHPKYVIVKLLEEESVCSCNIVECVHISVASEIWIENDYYIADNDPQVVQVSELLYCVFEGTYGLVSLAKKGTLIKCLTCKSRVTKCVHVEAYKGSIHEPINVVPTMQEFCCKSSVKIPYPFKGTDITKFGFYASGNPYPTHLVPKFDPSQKCQHGNSFNNGDPISKSWISVNNAKIHLAHISLSRCVYYRPTTGICGCRQEYDGRGDHLLYLDNANLFPYAWLFDILHNTHETRYPIQSAFRAMNKTRSVCGQEIFKSYIKTIQISKRHNSKGLDKRSPVSRIRDTEERPGRVTRTSSRKEKKGYLAAHTTALG